MAKTYKVTISFPVIADNQADAIRIAKNALEIYSGGEVVTVEVVKPTLKLRYLSGWGEWCVKWYDEDGKFDETKSYYTDDKQDAKDTMKMMQAEIDKA